jgi:quercetin dioxygenase-like cupin family protein
MMSEILLDSSEVASLPWRPFASGQGVRDRLLWQDPAGASYAGLMQMEPGTSVVPHSHAGAVHHLWVVSGECTINARALGAGSYVFVPQGLEHAIQRAGPTGCTLFYLYLRVAPAPQRVERNSNGPAGGQRPGGS